MWWPLAVVFAEASNCFEVVREDEEEEFVVGVGLAGGAPLVERRMGEGMSRHVACPSDHSSPLVFRTGCRCYRSYQVNLGRGCECSIQVWW